MPKESHDATEGKKIIINLLVMLVGFTIFGLVLYATMMAYDWFNICSDITDCLGRGYID